MRRKIQDQIRKLGTWKWNTDSTLNKGELIVSRRPHLKFNRKATDYLTCPNCTGVYTIKNIRNHFAICTKRAFKGTRNIKILSRAVEGRFSGEASEQLRGLIPVMRADAIVELIRYDWLLIVYGNLLCMKYNLHFQQNMIRAKLRLAGRVLHALRSINNEVTDFASIYSPKHYKSLIEAIKVVGTFNPATNEFGTPATASSAVTSIKQIGSILKCEYIEKENWGRVKITEYFVFLMESQFTSIINKRVKESQLQKKRDKDHKIPIKNDVRLLSEYLDRERKVCFERLSANYSKKDWIQLSELTIASIIVFNRRRVGETQNICVSEFNKRESIDETTNEELFGALSEKSKKVAKRFSRIKIRGKKGCFNLSVLMKADIVSCIELLLLHRTRVGISSENTFLFALPPSPGENRIRVVNACNVLTKLSTKFGAKDPSSLRGTNLRKHFATMCMALELNDDDVSEVAKFMGHAESVHRNHYRHNTIDREIVKIATLLEAAQGIEEHYSDSDNIGCDSDNEYDESPPKSVFQAGTKKREKNNEIVNDKSVKTYIADVSACRKRKTINSPSQPPKKVTSVATAGRKRKKTNGDNQPPKPTTVTDRKRKQKNGIKAKH